MIIASQALAAFVFFLPAGIANMSPVFANRVPLLNKWKTPLDFGKHYKGKRVFGDNKTWRGLIVGSIVAGSFSLLLNSLASGFVEAPIEFHIEWFLFGTWIGLGALLGDAVESFFKRQHGVPSGHSWFPWDQIDYVLGAILFSLVIVREPIIVYILTIGIYFSLHVAVSYIGYLLGLKDKPI